MTLHRVIFWLHLLCGTIAGAVILSMSVTGVLLAYEPQLAEWSERSVRIVSPPGPGAERLPVETFLGRARAARPDVRPTGVILRADPTASAIVQFGREGALFVDPYRGTVLGKLSRLHEIMHILVEWHRWLGSREVGRPITGACNLAFMGLALSGLYLWWPRLWTRHALRGIVWFAPSLRGRSRDWNWHNTIGLWCAPWLVVLTLTGAVMSYQWVNNLLYTLTGNEAPPAPAGPGGGPPGGGPPGVRDAARARGAETRGASRGESGALNLDLAVARAQSQAPGWTSLALRLPARPGDPISVLVEESSGWKPMPRGQLTLDPGTAEVIKWEPGAAQNLGRRLRAWVRPVHTGEVGGLAGQTIALLASAGGVMLVWTGLALAWRRFRSWRQRARELARARSRGVTAAVALALALGAGAADAADESLEIGLAAIRSLTGCFLVDYSFVEVESLRAGYARDPRVYDVNRDKSVKEWITAETLSPRRVRLQRILFAADLAGAVRAESLLRHQSEDWEHDAPFLYDFVAPQTWHVRDLRASPGLWTRRITNLDDGLRYQCASAWTTTGGYPEWSCANYAPIPGRESRDMGRADYHTLQRGTRIVAYGSSWLERQDNVKTVHAGGTRTPLARELGKTWYVRLPDAECAAAVPFARDGRAFWTLLREIWDEVLSGDAPFVERTPPGQPPRFVRMDEIEEEYQGRDLSDPAVREAARTRILRLIGEYRAQ